MLSSMDTSESAILDLRKRPSRNVVFWVISTMIFTALVYSTSCVSVLGPERTITLTYFTNPLADSMKNSAYSIEFFDRGSLRNTGLESIGENHWKLARFPLDAGSYVLQARSNDLSMAPYKYRFLPTMIVGYVSRLTGKTIPIAFALFNFAITVLTATLFTHYLIRDMGFSRIISLLGGVLFVTMVANVQTVPYPMVEPASFFFCILIFISIARKSLVLFVLSSVLGVATKEILAFSSLLWIVNSFPLANRSFRSILTTALISMAPIFAFVLIRVVLGGSAFEVNYGYDMLKGEFPGYGSRLLSVGGILDLCTKVFLSFSFLWFGLINLKKSKILWENSIAIPVVVLAAILLSSQIMRVVGVVFPIVIPAFLFFLRGFEPGHGHKTIGLSGVAPESVS